MARIVSGAPGSTSIRGPQVRGKIAVDLRRVAPTIGTAIVGHILERVGEGLDIKGKPFKAYSLRYRRFLAAAGESDLVDLRLTGGMLNSLAVRSIRIEEVSATIIVGPGTGTSKRVRAVRGRTTRKGRIIPGRLTGTPSKGSAKSLGRSPAHNVLGAILQRDRPWLGLSPDGRKAIARLIERTGIFGRS